MNLCEKVADMVKNKEEEEEEENIFIIDNY
jgi:hypothetical protein